MVYYKHLKTNAVISLDRLKEIYYSNDYKITFCKLTAFNEEPKRFEYKVEEIPFNEDFEILVLDNDFTIEEIHFIENLLYNGSYERYYSELGKSVESKLKKKKEDVIKERYINERII